MVGVWLGFVGVWLGLVGTDALTVVGYGNAILGIVCCAVLPILGIVTSRGPHRPKDAE